QLTSTLKQFTKVYTFVAPTVVFARPYWRLGFVATGAIDFTVRIAGSQLEKGSAPTSTIITTNAGTITRAADVLTVPIQGGVYQFEATLTGAANSTWTDAVNPTVGYTVPTSPSPRRSLAAPAI